MASLPPGPTLPAVFQLWRWVYRPIPFMEECARRYGECFTVRFPGYPPIVLFSNPDAVKEIFTGDPDTLFAGETRLLLKPVVGQYSLLLLDGARHRYQQRLLMPPFHGERVYTCGETMREITDRVVESWPVGHPFLLHPEIEKITLNIILQTIFGIDKEPDLRRLYDRLLRILTLGASPLALIPRLQALLGPFTGQQRLRRLVQEVDEILFTQIARNRAVGSAGYTDVLFLLINARDESGRPMSEIELRDTLMTLVVAGHDTTATSLAWIFLYILQYPDVLEKIREELYRVVGSGPVLPQQIDQLAYLDATVKEVQRVIPIFPLASRRLHTPMCIGGWDLPAGVVAGSCIYLTHRRPDIWPNPEQFDPDRFLGKKANPYEFFPFGGGAHYCIGAAFALYEMKVVLAEVLSRVALHVASGYTVRVVRRSLTLAPSAGVPVVVDARRSPLSAREI